MSDGRRGKTGRREPGWIGFGVIGGLACADADKLRKVWTEPDCAVSSDTGSGDCSGDGGGGLGGGARGDLLWAEEIARLTRAELQAAAGPAARVDNGYTVYVIGYRTSGGVATGTVTLPLTDGGAVPAGGWPVVANAHGTIGLDDPCRLSGTVAGSALAGLFGARGTIGVAPDYLGLGGPGLHPYLDARVEAESVLDGVRAAGQLARTEGLEVSPRLAVVGLSQGGHAALATAALAAEYAPEVDLRVVGAAAPASGFIEHWREGINLPGPHLAYHALLSASFASIAGVPAEVVFSTDFAPDAKILREMCLWSPHFGDEPTLLDALPTHPTALFSTEFRASFAGVGPPLDWVEAGAARMRLSPFRSPARVVVWQGLADKDVLPAHTAELVDVLRQGGQSVELRWVPGADHLGVAFGFLGAIDAAGAEADALILAELHRD